MITLALILIAAVCFCAALIIEEHHLTARRAKRWTR